MKISSYALDSTPNLGDKLIGTDVDNMNATKNFTIAQVLALGTPIPYKSYTALLTQSGVSNIIGVAGDGEYINLGVTYQITDNPDNYDLTIYGAPNNIAGTFFVANQTVPLPYTNSLQLVGNTGAPVVTVLKNTIGNIWWTYNNTGNYSANSNGLFIENKTIAFTTLPNWNFDITNAALGRLTDNEAPLVTFIPGDGPFNNFDNLAIEIRVYN